MKMDNANKQLAKKRIELTKIDTEYAQLLKDYECLQRIVNLYKHKKNNLENEIKELEDTIEANFINLIERVNY